MNSVLDVSERYGLPTYTDGWFEVATSAELRRGQVVVVDYFGTSLTLLRDRSGGLHAGPSRCPLTGRRQDPCRPGTARWDVHEQHGAIYVWRHHAGEPPSRPLPKMHDFHEREWSDPVHHTTTIRAHAQELEENGVDISHFPTVHQTAPTLDRLEWKGTTLIVYTTFSDRLFGRNVVSKITHHMLEPGYYYSTFTGIPFAEVRMLNSVVPKDDEFTDHRMTYWTRSRTPVFSPLFTKLIAKTFMAVYMDDVEIWEHKIYRAKPMLVPGDGPIHSTRRWHAQFFPPTPKSTP